MAPEAPTRVAGYDLEQIANAAIIADVARSLGLGDQAALLGVMCAMGASSLRNIGYGDWETNGVLKPDGSPTTSIGLFQQQASWGSVADRMDPIYSAWAFYRMLVRVRDWATIEPTRAIHSVQVNADPNHYAKYEQSARAVLAAIPDLRVKGVIVADPMDIIEVPWQPGHFARRALVDAVDRSGRPRGNSWGRLKDEQQRAWDRYQNGTGSPADNPNDPNNYELGHVRFAAVDIDYSPETHRRLTAQGLVRPFSWESWHYRLPGDVRKWPLVNALPTITPKGPLMALSDAEQSEVLNGVRANGVLLARVLERQEWLLAAAGQDAARDAELQGALNFVVDKTGKIDWLTDYNQQQVEKEAAAAKPAEPTA